MNHLDHPPLRRTTAALLALVAGLMLIQSENTQRQIAAAVEVDTDLLLDELPPSAYSDPGFVEFLKHQGD